MPTIPVGILGATGMVGQQFIALLADHPWFRVTWLGASQRSEGKPYREAAAWRLQAPPADGVADLTGDAGTRAQARLFRPRFLGRRRDRSRLRAGGPHHRQQLAELPDGRHRPVDDSRD